MTVRLAVLSAACTFTECGRCADPGCEHRCHVLTPPPAAGSAELRAAGKAYEALRRLDYSSALRAVDWLTGRLSADEWRREQARARTAGGGGG